MRLIILVSLLLGIALAAGAVHMAQSQIGQYEAERDKLLVEQARLPPMTTVVIVKRALKYGERFTAADLDTIRIQADRLPDGTFRRITAKADSETAGQAVFPEGETRPRAARRSFEANEVLLSGKVTSPGMDAGIMAALQPNMRAFTIQVDRVSGVSGFLRPGDRVDVYWSGTVRDQPVTRLIDSLRLIAVDQSADADRSAETVNARTVTAEVTPEQVAALTLAQSTGKLTLSLVGQNDTAEPGEVEIDRNQFLGLQAARPAAAGPQTCTIRTRKGTELQETAVPCPPQP
ncbi:Flp pilus assembly protein CpaB [Sinirhodobacter populi]|uniref:Flp pilus assembly protein CpaB n=1 Tax=Paenirhodobacter populi TaxID=2306993 RepID=A0A443K9A8_9RHOB|nr:Flp pilus assembly protein CpaB [Sinirhodobacter populi]RWR29379.1 Flp pilus assembly protein CpaB [Sinirhodobacter populi]